MTPLEPHSARPRIQSDSRCVRDDQVLVLAQRNQQTMLTGVLAPPHPLGRPLFEVVSPQTLYCAWSPVAALEGTCARLCVRLYEARTAESGMPQRPRVFKVANGSPTPISWMQPAFTYLPGGRKACSSARRRLT